MGRRASAGRVEIRPNSLRISFQWQGEQCRETVKMNGVAMLPTKANTEYARRLAQTVVDRIRVGTFSYTEFFPDSARAEPAVPVKIDLFGGVADDWIASKGQLEAATKDQYGTGVRRWKRMFGTDTPMTDVTYQVIAKKVGEEKWPSAKSANNYLIVLRGIMAFYYHGLKASQNPMVGIENLTVVRKKPDPLTADERDKILADMARHYPACVVAYFTFAFFTGMRPEEIIALQWGDIDEPSGVIRVCRVRTFKGTERDGSKTGQERDVDLLPQASAALTTMRPMTSLKSDYIFENPITNAPWHDERSQRDTFWKPTLKRLRIRQRRAYATRHTFATVALMGGVNAAYVAAQMGHSSTKMFFETYARWINGADKGVQRSAMAAAFGDISPEFPQSNVAPGNSLISLPKSGRRDWIRTKQKGNGG